jgi:putative alpha-1,2-mannosidase
MVACGKLMSMSRFSLALCVSIVQYSLVNGGVLEYVDPLIGTSYWDESYIGNTGDYGNTVPQVGVPNAHSPWSPQTQATEKKCYAPYYYHGIDV